MSERIGNIGKKMPYRTPDNFFETLNEQILTSVKSDKRRVNIGTIWLRSVISAAASVLLLLAFTQFLPKEPRLSYDDVAEAFDELSQDDKDILYECYIDDIFMNNYNE